MSHTLKDIGVLILVGALLGATYWGLWRVTKWFGGNIEGTTENRLQRIEKKVDLIIESDLFKVEVRPRTWRPL